MTDPLQEIEQQAEALPTETIAQVEETAQEIVAEAKQAEAAPPAADDGDVGYGAHAAHAILDQIDALAGKVQAYADQGHAIAVTRQLRDLVVQARGTL